MEDLISRQAAIDLAMQYCPDDDGTCSKADEDIRNLLDELEELPPVQPEQPQLFQAIRKVCKYHTFSRDRYGTDKWEDACHCPVMIPQGSSWGECNEGICPVFNS